MFDKKKKLRENFHFHFYFIIKNFWHIFIFHRKGKIKFNYKRVFPPQKVFLFGQPAIRFILIFFQRNIFLKNIKLKTFLVYSTDLRKKVSKAGALLEIYVFEVTSTKNTNRV